MRIIFGFHHLNSLTYFSENFPQTALGQSLRYVCSDCSRSDTRGNIGEEYIYKIENIM